VVNKNIALRPRGPRHHTAAATSTIPLRGISGFAGTVDVEGRLCGDWYFYFVGGISIRKIDNPRRGFMKIQGINLTGTS